MLDIIIDKKDLFREKKQRIMQDGKDSLFVVSDFDRTLTKYYSDTHKVLSLIQILREGNFLGDEYTQKARGLFEHYHPYEIDPSISFEERNVFMHDWWSNHNSLLIEYGLSTQIVEEVVKTRKVGFRDGALDFFNTLNDNKIPLIIVSASGLGFVIDDYLVKNNVYFSNTKIITNNIEFDEKGKAIRAQEPVITTTNKYLAVAESLPGMKDINGKKRNIILLGDNYEDEKMATSFIQEDIIKIGFLNENIDERIDEYKEAFDVVILNDGKMDFVNNLVGELIEK